MQVFDTLGRLITVLANKEYMAGTHRIDFDSEGLPPGIYYARLQNGIDQQVCPMMKVR